MVNDSSLPTIKRYADRSMIIAATLLALSIVLVILAVAMPIEANIEVSSIVSERQLQSLPQAKQDIKPFLARIAGRYLIKPSQVRAAVKDSGAAQRLVKKLTLQGIVQIGSDLIAYIGVDKQGTKTVRQGEKLLDFVVQDVKPGKVTLTLEGVEVILEH